MAVANGIVRSGQLEQRILLIRGQRVILDADLADLYGATTKALNQAMKRNRTRFPSDFAFRLTAAEWENLKSQIVTSSGGHGGRRKLPLAFTEHGCLMAANILNSPRAVRASIYVVRTFVRLRVLLSTNQELAHRLAELERRLSRHDGQIKALIDAIRELMQPAPAPIRASIGFHTEAVEPKRRARMRPTRARGAKAKRLRIAPASTAASRR